MSFCGLLAKIVAVDRAYHFLLLNVFRMFCNSFPVIGVHHTLHDNASCIGV